jgi:biopolymer transport protein ExbB/TolQ
MPFRRWFASRGAHHPFAYSMATLAVGMLACMIASVLWSNANTDRAVKRMVAIERQRQADEQAKEAVEAERARQVAEASRAASCRVIQSMADAYRKTPPDTPSETYDNVAKAWADLASFC